MKESIELIKSLDINTKDYVIVACSGGPDSMFLLRLLKDLNYQVVCAHVNHKMRSESDYEYDFVKDYCEKNDIIFEGNILEGYEYGNFENYAREFRYQFFEELIKKYKAKYLFTAHHGDDLMETILMRLVRGSSLKGYASFSKLTKKKDYFIVRPLIFLTKDEILAYNKEKDIPFVIDESNNSDDYTRNRFRHHVLPFLKEEDSRVHERFLLFSDEIKECVNYLDQITEDILSKIYINNILDLDEFNKLDKYLQKRIITYIIHLWYPDNLYLINLNHLSEIMKIISSTKPNLKVVLPEGITVIKEYNKLIFKELDETTDSYEYEFKDELEVPTGTLKTVSDEDSKSNYIIRLNSKDIKLPLTVRSRKDGDKIKIKNLNGTKKVNDIFIDNKITLDKRNKWPLLVDANNTILWVPGLKKSEFDVAFNGNYDIIIKYFEREDNNE